MNLFTSSLAYTEWTIGLAIAAYAIFGGADFGGGVWDFCARGPRSQEQRAAVAVAMGPVWEANHVWLIFVIVTVFTCFPSAFADLSLRLYVPLTIVLLGVVLRGTAFVFRAHAHEAAHTSLILGTVFGAASLVTPFGFGMAVSTLITGAAQAEPFSQVWYSPLSLVLGCFAIALCAQIAGVFLTVETKAALQEDFRIRSLIASLIVAGMGAGALVLATHANTPTLGFRPGSAVYAIGSAMIFGLLTMAGLYKRLFSIARITVIAQMLAILAGWFQAQIPFIIPGRLTFTQAAAPEATLHAFMLLTCVGLVVLTPALALLFMVFKGKNPAFEEGS